MKIFYEKKEHFLKDFFKFVQINKDENYKKIDKTVEKIIRQVKLKGDKALIDLTKKFDKNLITKSEMLISKKTRNRYIGKIDKNIIKSFQLAIKNITNFHREQLPKNYIINKNNLITGTFWKPIEEVGLYVPGGRANYPSSLLMSVIPAKVAGVKRIVVTTPIKEGSFNPYLMFLLNMLNIKEVYQIGGAQAIAALAYGTEIIKPVSKIFGPGNSFVSSAKRQVHGKIGIDLIAGPSEIVVVADRYNNPSWVASDLMAQAEHDVHSKCILITNDKSFALQVKKEIKSLVSNLSKKEIINKSLSNFGAIVILKNFEKAADIINFIAPEHVHLQNRNISKIFKKLINVGAVFLGKHSTEAFGDYIAGTNHVLPTSGTAKFSSGLGVLDFMKRTSYVRLNQKSFNNLSNSVLDMASIENLDGHKLSVSIRQSKKNKYNK